MPVMAVAYETRQQMKKALKDYTDVGGVYGIYDTQYDRVYIGSTKSLSKRILDGHLKVGAVGSNTNLQEAIRLLGLACFIVIIFKVIGPSERVHPKQREAIEQLYINAVPYNTLFN